MYYINYRMFSEDIIYIFQNHRDFFVKCIENPLSTSHCWILSLYVCNLDHLRVDERQTAILGKLGTFQRGTDQQHWWHIGLQECQKAQVTQATSILNLTETKAGRHGQIEWQRTSLSNLPSIIKVGLCLAIIFVQMRVKVCLDRVLSYCLVHLGWFILFPNDHIM